MGRIVHDAIVVTTSDIRPGGLPDIDAFRASLPESLRPLVVGPIPAPLNGYVSYAFLPDGSKEGWGASDEGDTYRDQFAALFNHRYDDGSTHDEVVALRFGGDHRDENPAPDADYTH
ncbi:hypothetical protein [Streptomyces sp. NRRL S-1022]|uniref:hypothetical protein n=1 Tax=Streptomyces sp. NRRL S-1022 TaxID=1463880 RepID=UPI00068BBB0E|nr:hypothetical protein [Streptomyces sp. NRRL S-1022]